MSNERNLIPNSERTPEQLKAQTKKGGIASGKARREKKLMSQIFADYLETKHDIFLKDGSKQNLSGHAYMAKVMDKVLSRGDSASVALMKVIAEATEGSKIKLSGNVPPVTIIIEGVKSESE